MDYDNYSIEGASASKEFKSNNPLPSYGCSQSDVHDWLADMVLPPDYKDFNIIEIKFKGSRKEFYLNLKNTSFKNGELVVVEGNTGGYDVGHVSLTGELVLMQLRKKNIHKDEVVKKIYRGATPDDVTKWKLAKEMELDILYKTRVLAIELGLSMKLTDVEYQGDKSKATFYYTAEGRVDFRELIKRLSETFRTRIEMRQIGLREEAVRIGGVGPCGSYICCHTWPTDFKTGSPRVSRFKQNPLHKRQDNKFECYINDESENKQLIKLANLKNDAQEDNNSLVSKVLSYENVVGQDSITRFDHKGSKRKKNNHKNKKRKP